MDSDVSSRRTTLRSSASCGGEAGARLVRGPQAIRALAIETHENWLEAHCCLNMDFTPEGGLTKGGLMGAKNCTASLEVQVAGELLRGGQLNRNGRIVPSRMGAGGC